MRPLEEIQGAAKNLLCTTHVECSMYECKDIILTPNMSLFIPPWTQSVSPTLSNTMMTQIVSQTRGQPVSPQLPTEAQNMLRVVSPFIPP